MSRALNDSKDARQVSNYLKIKAKHEKKEKNTKSRNVERQADHRKVSVWLRGKMGQEDPYVLEELDVSVKQELIWMQAIELGRACRKSYPELVAFIRSELKTAKQKALDDYAPAPEPRPNKRKINVMTRSMSRSKTGDQHNRKITPQVHARENLKNMKPKDCTRLSKKYASRFSAPYSKRMNIIEIESTEEGEYDESGEEDCKDDQIDDLITRVEEMAIVQQSLVSVVDEVRKKLVTIANDLAVLQVEQNKKVSEDDFYALEEDMKDYCRQSMRQFKRISYSNEESDVNVNLNLPNLDLDLEKKPKRKRVQGNKNVSK